MGRPKSPQVAEIRERIAEKIAALVPMAEIQRSFSAEYGLAPARVRDLCFEVRKEMSDLSRERIDAEMGRLLARLDRLGRAAEASGDIREALAVEVIRCRVLQIVEARYGQAYGPMEGTGLAWSEYAKAARKVTDMAAQERRAKITATVGKLAAAAHKNGLTG